METPIEITTIEWHPENPNALFGGCLNGQIIVWDLSATEKRITAGKSVKAIGDDDDGAVGGGGEED